MKFYTYDCKEDIERCLNCKKKECNNCYGNVFSAFNTDKYDDGESEDK